jgi:uncharacterized protein
MERYVRNLSNILTLHNVCKSHGIGHAIQVMKHAEKALEYETNLCSNDKNAVLFASLLHDADDKKFFPVNKNHENVRKIIDDKPPEFVDLVIQMIDLVSASKNGDNIPEHIKDKLWMLIPRYSDRLEAIGLIGIKRSYTYNITINAPMFLDSTPRLTEHAQIMDLSLKRFKLYKGDSVSMMDHYYDKLIAITVFPISNPYFETETAIRRKPMLDFVKYFGENGAIDMSKINSI